MVGAPSFSQLYLCIQPLYNLHQKSVPLLALVNFHLPIPELLFNKSILTISANTPFLYNSGIFHLPIFACNHPAIYTKNIFPTLTI